MKALEASHAPTSNIGAVREFRFHCSTHSSPQMREWLARIVERALSRVAHPDSRSVAVIAALRTGPCADDIQSAAYDAAHEKPDTLKDAAYYAAYAAYYASYATEQGPYTLQDAERAAIAACRVLAELGFDRERDAQVAEAMALTGTETINLL